VLAHGADASRGGGGHRLARRRAEKCRHFAPTS
jgi:hypothetical protein